LRSLQTHSVGNDCDHSKLTPLQAKQTASSEYQRNLSACKDGQETCDYTKLTAAEAKTLADAEHKRNYAACLKGTDIATLLDSQSTRPIPFSPKTTDSWGNRNKSLSYPEGYDSATVSGVQ